MMHNLRFDMITNLFSIKGDDGEKEVSMDCPLCMNLILDAVIDHKISRDCGGTDNIKNLQVVCRGCNSKKREYFDKLYRTKYNKIMRLSSHLRELFDGYYKGMEKLVIEEVFLCHSIDEVLFALAHLDKRNETNQSDYNKMEEMRKKVGLNPSECVFEKRNIQKELCAWINLDFKPIK